MVLNANTCAPDELEGASTDLSPIGRDFATPAAPGSFVQHFGHSVLSELAACVKSFEN